MRLGLLRSATRGDLLLALSVTVAIEGLAVLALGSSRERTPAVATRQQPSWSVPINLRQTTPQPTATESTAPKLLNPKIKLGGGRPGRARNAKPPPSPREALSTAPPRAPVRHSNPVAAPPGPTTSAPVSLPSEPAQADAAEYDTVPTEEVGDAPPGEGFPDGEADGTVTDPLEAHAIRLYRARVQSWFASRFNLTGTGLPQTVLRKLRVSATISVDTSRRMSGFSMTSSGNSDFDAAVRRALSAVQGMELPPSPSHYPGAVQGQISIEFICGEGTCN